MSMPESNQPAIDLAETWEFLQRVEAGGSFTFQTYHDVPRGYAKDPELSEILHWPAGDITKQRQVFDRLAKVNTTLRPTDKDKLLRGAAICVMLNETDLQGRGAKNVTHIRANGSDNDTGHEDYPISPSITVESSPGHFQDWFLWNKRPTNRRRPITNQSMPG
jgi:hypothetical protein